MVLCYGSRLASFQFCEDGCSNVFQIPWKRLNFAFVGHSSIKSHGRNALYWKSNGLQKQREGTSELFELQYRSGLEFCFWFFESFLSQSRITMELLWPEKRRGVNRFNYFIPMLSLVILLTVCHTLLIILVWRIWY